MIVAAVARMISGTNSVCGARRKNGFSAASALAAIRAVCPM